MDCLSALSGRERAAESHSAAGIFPDPPILPSSSSKSRLGCCFLFLIASVVKITFSKLVSIKTTSFSLS